MVSRIWQTAATPLVFTREAWARLEPAWRVAFIAFLVARIAYSTWALIILLLFPIVVQNLELFGTPVVAVFNLEKGERYVYARQVGNDTLAFRAGADDTLVDAQTGSVWSLRDGNAQSGTYQGQTLQTADYSPEEVFPYHGAAIETGPWLGVWQRFDTNWYLKIARDGYIREDGSTVYFPLYPLLLRLTDASLAGRADLGGGIRALGQRDLLAGIVVSNLALIGALYFLYKLTDELLGSAVARRTVAYVLVFPTAFFLFAAYTESLFLLLCLASLYIARRGQFGWAAVWGALAALTRLQGVLLIVPLAYLWWNSNAADSRMVCGFDALAGYWHEAINCLKAQVRPPDRTRIFSRALKPHLEALALFLVPLATLAFLAFTQFSLLNSYEGQLHAQFVLPWENAWAAVSLLIGGQGSIVDALNLLAVLMFGTSLIAVWRKLPRELFLYALLMYLAPLLRMTTLQPLVSMTRYVVVMFPVFMVWAMAGKNPWLNRAVLYLSFPLNLYLSAQFFLWGWVA